MVVLTSEDEIMVAAATCPPASVVEETFNTLLRVRQAEFEAQAGMRNPDAWDTSAAEPGVEIDITGSSTAMSFPEP